MTTNIHRESAKIYQFPSRISTTVDGHRDEVKSATTLTSPRVAEAASGSGWYHDAAVKEAERARKR
jgi:hypothetical protein